MQDRSERPLTCPHKTSSELGRAGSGDPISCQDKGEWCILVVTNMADDETGAPGI